MARAALYGVLVVAPGMVSDVAQAHAIVVLARPAPNSLLPQGMFEIRIEFNSRIDPERSRLALHRPDGSVAIVTTLPGGAENVLAGNADPTMPGRWRLDWQVLSLDGHITRGEVSFSVVERRQRP